MTINHLAKLITAFGGAALIIWQLATQIDAAFLAHLDSKFATKDDLQRIEQKVDLLLLQGHHK